MSRKNRSRSGNGRKGATTIEFALVVPIIFTLVLGLMEWGRFEMIRQVSSTAAFNAARQGSLPGAVSTEVEERVDSILAVYFISGATTTATLSENETTVRVSIPVNENSLVLLRFFGNMTIEREFTLTTR